MLAESFGRVAIRRDAFAAAYDSQLEACASSFCARLSEPARGQAADLMEDARIEAIAKLDSLQGRRQRLHHNPSDSLIVPAGGEDPEQESTEGLQRRLSTLADDQRVDQITARLQAAHRELREGVSEGG